MRQAIAETCPRPTGRIIETPTRSWTEAIVNSRNLIMLLLIAFVFNAAFLGYQYLKKHGRRATYLPIIGGEAASTVESEARSDLELAGRQPIM